MLMYKKKIQLLQTNPSFEFEDYFRDLKVISIIMYINHIYKIIGICIFDIF